MKLEERIRYVRVEVLRWSQPQLARTLNVSPRTVLRWEGGKTKPHDRLLKVLAEIAEIDVAWLRTGEGPVPGPRAEANPVAEPTPEAVRAPLRGRNRRPFDSERDMRLLLTRIGAPGEGTKKKQLALGIYRELIGQVDLEPPPWWSVLYMMVSEDRL